MNREAARRERAFNAESACLGDYIWKSSNMKNKLTGS